MTKEEAKEFLIDISYKLGNMAIEYLTEKDGEKMREAIKVLDNECRRDILPKYEAKVITRGNCMMCGKELTEGLFFCKECEDKARESEDKE